MPLMEIAKGVFRMQAGIANVYLVDDSAGNWTLVDTGLPGKANAIRQAAESTFGAGTRPTAILLTHGHSDHAGSALELASFWGLPVYAHRMERPYLSGRSNYPEKDPTVGGAFGFMIRFMKVESVNLGQYLHELPDGHVPGLPGWQALETPGHAPGHVSYYSPDRGILLAGDAITTVDVDSVVGLISQAMRVCRPPAPVNYNWQEARTSVRHLAELRPEVIGAGHGVPMSGPDAANGLERLALEFPIPLHGRYANDPARVSLAGVTYQPPPAPDPLPRVAAAVAGGIVAGVSLAAIRKRSR